ncbi:MAG: AAA family ATPase [Nitrospiraceae bacterium]
MMKWIEQFKSARRAGVPLVGIETPDMTATIQEITKSLNGDAEKVAVMVWDIVRGLSGFNKKGQATVKTFGDAESLRGLTANPTEALAMIAEKLNGEAIVVMMNAHRFVENEGVAQAIWNLRDPFKAAGQTLVLLGPVLKMPVELERDVVVLEEALPDDAQLTEIVKGVFDDGGVSVPAKLDPIVEAARGLAAFSAEQAAAMALTAKGINLPAMWERKRKMIEQTPGLSVVRNAPTFNDVGGIENAKTFGKALFNGTQPPSCVVFVDEIEKAMAGSFGAGGDTSGVSQDALGVLLRSMEDNEWTGQILVGPPGCSKSMYGKALGASYNVPTIALDLGAAKGSLVGQSEQQVRQMVKVIQGIAGSGAYWVATCNRLETLPPELRRRFCDGVWYFDLPTADEREAIWKVNLEKYAVKADQDRPDDDGWTGADVRNCCRIAARFKASLVAASQFLTPVCKSDPDSIERLRKIAEGKFLSASHQGVYQQRVRSAGDGKRKIRTENN